MSELSKVYDEINETKVEVGKLSTKVDLHTETLTKIVEKHDDILHHNPHGLVLTVDRLEQTQKKRTWIMRIIGGSLATILVKFLWDFLFV